MSFLKSLTKEPDLQSARQSRRPRTHRQSRIPGVLYAVLAPALLHGSSSAAADTAGAPGGFWELLIALFVCGVAASVAYLCYFAVRLWSGYWKALALAPLVVLGIWLAFLLTVIVADLAPRALWTVEVLFWAMATTVYLVILFTARRTFEKSADQSLQPTQTGSQEDQSKH